MAKKKPKINRFASMAQQRALVRFGPEIAALVALQQDAGDQYQAALGQAQGSAISTQQAVREARPQLEAVYDRGAAEQARTREQLFGRDLQALGPAGDFLRGSADLGTAAASTARTQSLDDLAQRGVRAAEGQAFQSANARDQFTSTIAKIYGRRKALGQEIGAFEAATLGELEEAQAARDFTADQNAAARDFTAGQNRLGRGQDAKDRASREDIAAADRESRERLAASKPAKPRKSQFSLEQRTSTARTLRSAIDALDDLAVPRSEPGALGAAKSLILNGLKGSDGKTTLLAPQTKDRFLAQVAAERYVNGGLSEKTNNLLRQRYGIRAKPLPRKPPAEQAGALAGLLLGSLGIGG